MYRLGGFVAELFGSEALKKRILRYLLKRYVGQFLLEKLSLDQLTIDIISGTGIIKNLSLDVQALNDISEQLNLPLKFVDGFIGEICLSIPWKSLFSGNCFIEVSGVSLTLHPKHRLDDVSLVDSMIDSMSTSMQIAQECLSQAEVKEELDLRDFYCNSQLNQTSSNDTGFEGLELFAEAIDTILKRVKVRFVDVSVRLEYEPNESTGIAVEICVNEINYFDEAGLDKNAKEKDKVTKDSEAAAAKKFLVKGVHIYTDEFINLQLQTEHDIGNCNLQDDINLHLLEENYSNAFDKEINTSIDLSNLKLLARATSNNENEVRKSAEKVLFTKISGCQEIKLRIREADEEGPKVHIEAKFGSFFGFFTPRQIHLLMEFAEAYSSPELPTHDYSRTLSNVINQKPMNQNDYNNIESELQRNIKQTLILDNLSSHALNVRETWSIPQIDNDEIFHPMDLGIGVYPSKLGPMTGSHISEFGSSVITNASTQNGKTGYNGACDKSNNLKNETNLSMRLRFHSISLILLQEDLLVSSDIPGETVTDSSLANMLSKAKEFFACVGNTCHSDNYLKEYKDLKMKLEDWCPYSHLRVIASPFSFKTVEKTFGRKWERHSDITFGWSEIVETVINSNNSSSSKILSFSKNDMANETVKSSPAIPNIWVTIKETCCTTKVGSLRSANIPKTEVMLDLDNCQIELDFSIIDRLSTLLCKQNVIKSMKIANQTTGVETPVDNLDNRMCFDQIFKDESNVDGKVNVKINAHLLSSKIFFPIPDLRPLSDIERVPWWKRNLRNETLHLNFEELLCDIAIDTKAAFNNFEVQCNDLHILFQQNEDCSPIHLIRASMHNDDSNNVSDLIRMVVQVFPLHSQINLEDRLKPNNENLMNKSMMGFLEDVSNKDPSIFTKRKIVSHQKDDMNELTLPSSKEEINRFMNETLENVQFKLDVSLPQVQFILPTKHILEILYNRLLADLLLWTPSSHIEKQFNVSEGLKKDFTFQQFKFCKSLRNMNYPEEMPSMQSMTSDNDLDEFISPKQTYFASVISIGKLIGLINLPYRDHDGKLIQIKQGELLLSASDCTIFVASGFRGEMDTCLTSVSAKKVSLSHKPCVKKSISPIYLKSDLSHFDLNGNNILYPSSSFTKMEGSTQVNNDDCLILCIKTVFNSLKNEKVLQLAGGLNNVTFNHIVSHPSESWISQLQDMFSLEDYPIDGYSLPSVITELNFHLKYCSILYQPLNLPLKSVVLSESVFISSNMNLEGDSSVLLILIEDAGVFLSPNMNATTIKLQENYICVVHLGILEIFTKINGIKSEFSLYNDMLHIRTCSDSFKALLELLIYIANEGDLVIEADVLMARNSKFDNNLYIQQSKAKDTINFPKANLSREMNNHSIVEVMMQEAMMDSSPTESSDKSTNINEVKETVSEFYFPDESDKSAQLPCHTEIDSNVMVESFVDDTASALREALEECSDYIESTATTMENEFCVLDKVPGSGIKSPSGIPQAQDFKTQILPILMPLKDIYYEVVEDSPIYCLKKERETMAKTRHMVRELSVTWHMYGGQDFKVGPTKCISSSKFKSKGITKYEKSKKSTSVTFSDGEACIISCAQHSDSLATSHNKNPNMKWYIIGGSDRNHDILMELQLSKIKVLHESFAELSKMQSRNILNISDIEIRDRLVSSQINKFLYQYYTEACPRQAKSNMVSVVATTVKNDPRSHSPETALTVSLRPLRLHVDQDSLIFLGKFFSDILAADVECESGEEELPFSGKSMPLHAPVMSINTINISHLSDKNVSFDCNKELDEKLDLSQPIYFKSFVFSPDVPIKIDYHGKHIDINSHYGPIAGLIIGLGQLNNSEITLKRIEFLNGVLGVNKLLGSVSEEWINDIRKHQLPSILGGVGPMHSFVQLANGIKDLIWLPIEQYQKDGRLLMGIQRGTSSFASSSAYATLDLSGKFVSCIQSAAETMYDIVSPGPSVRRKFNRRKNVKPQDIREGIASAVGLVRHGLGDTATTICRVAAEEHFHKGLSGAVGGVLRQIPPTVVQPIILASEATCTVIGGLQSQLVPDARKEAFEKWKV